jgi:hypothetical protein
VSRHTPGPWVAYEATERAPFPVGVPVAVGTKAGGGSNATIVCEMVAQGEGGKYLRDTTNANACLIAAAPDLLALLKLLRDDWFEPHYGCNDIGYAAQLRDYIRAAIAKAEGR